MTIGFLYIYNNLQYDKLLFYFFNNNTSRLDILF